MGVWKQLRAILLLPGTVTVVVPGIIHYSIGPNTIPSPWNSILRIIGTVFMLFGLILMVWTIRLFISIGKGTLAPWNPTQRLVVRGIYRHVRNPMIAGVACVLLGEATLFGSLPLLGWFALFYLINMIYIPFVEEPGLVKRFGDDYLLYKKNVPRWIPRLKPWETPEMQ